MVKEWTAHVHTYGDAYSTTAQLRNGYSPYLLSSDVSTTSVTKAFQFWDHSILPAIYHSLNSTSDSVYHSTMTKGNLVTC